MDIVERLKQAATGDGFYHARQLKLDAAEEIERLRRIDYEEISRVARMEAEIERLRAELAMERLRATLARADLAADQGAEERR